MDKEKIESIIQQLQDMEVDGETMQYILNELGLQEQLHKQLVVTHPLEWTINFLEVRSSK